MKRIVFFIFIIVFISLCSFAEVVIFQDSFSYCISYPGAWYISSNQSMRWGWPYGYAYVYSYPYPCGPSYPYPNDLQTYMQLRNIDLSGYSSANLRFNWMVDTQPTYDYLSVRVRDQYGNAYERFRISGPYGSAWHTYSIDLTPFVGQSGLTIEFYFYSNSSYCGQDYGYYGVGIDNVILTAEYDSINVTSPNGGETLMTGSTSNITWNSAGNVSNVMIELSTDNGSTWSPITASPTPNDGEYSWTVPDTPSTQCLVRISDALDGDPSDTSDAVFSIVETPAIQITSPNGSENWMIGTAHNITWESEGTVGDVSIELSTDNGSTWSTIISSTANDGEYSWTVPDTPSTQCLVRIKEASDGSPSDTSDAAFSIVQTPTINITSPNGGENWMVRTTHNITWESAGAVGDVEIELSTNSGSTWSTIISSTANDGEYSWTVPDSPSKKCLVRVKEASDGSPSDVSDAAFSIVRTPTIQITSPNGSESWEVGSAHTITWGSTGNVGDVLIELSTDNGTTWSLITPSPTPNDKEYSWTVPDTPSTQCLVRIKEASDGDPSDTSDAVFSIVKAPTIKVTSPNGGESWEAGTTHNITWTSASTTQNVKIEYSINNGNSWILVIASTPNDELYEWKIPNTASSECLVRISDVSNSSLYDVSDDPFSITKAPEIALNRTHLNFGADTGGNVTDTQDFLIENNGGGTLTWSISSNVNWLIASPSTGTNSGVVNVYVNPSGLSPGVYSGGILTISASNASNSPQTITVILTVFRAGRDDDPFGTFETPQNGSTVRSSVAVTGWVLDDIGVEAVEIWRKNWVVDESGDGKWEEKFVGNAVFVEGARPDVELAYPRYPMNYQAGWGYMMLTNFLPNQGNGDFIIIAKAMDKTGKEVTLGEKAIYCDNKNAVKPFGAIDTPSQGGTASGSSFINWGWVLTPQPNSIPTDGSTINVIVDGVNIGHPTYNIYRSDIANLFPGYANSNGAAGYFYLDTSNYKNGIHTIQWTASDSGGNSDGIGSRYFTIRNLGGTGRLTSGSTMQWSGSTQYRSIKELSDIPVRFAEPVYITKGFTPGTVPKVIVPDENGVINIEIRELERIAVLLFDNKSADSKIIGCLKVGDRLRALPIGSTLDTRNAIFYWQPGPGFLGEYNLIFIETERNELKKINVKILPATFK